MLKAFVILLMSTLIFVGCDRTDKIMDGTSAATLSDTPAIPVQLMMLIDYSEGDKEMYLQWIASIAATLQAPKEVLRIRVYDNVQADMTPHQLVVFAFGSFLDAATYMNRSEIAAIFADIPNRSPKATFYTFIQRSSFRRDEVDDYPLKEVLFINYWVGGKESYLQWADSVSEIVLAPPQLKALAAYENYYGEQPHRLVVGEFASQEDFDVYLEEIQVIDAEFETQVASQVRYTFQVRSDYINTPDENR